jgi:hypothetical protein
MHSFSLSHKESHTSKVSGRGLRRSPSAIDLRHVVGDKRILSKLALFGYRVDSLEERLVGPPTGVSLPDPFLSLCARGNASGFRLPDNRPGGPKAISYQSISIPSSSCHSESRRQPTCLLQLQSRAQLHCTDGAEFGGRRRAIPCLNGCALQSTCRMLDERACASKTARTFLTMIWRYFATR